MTESGKKIIGRFGIVYILIVCVMLAIVYNIMKIQLSEREEWLTLAKKNDPKILEVAPIRGNIYSSEGQLMASSLPTYYIYMDMRVEALNINNGSLFYDKIDSLSECMANYFKDKSKAAYKQEITREFKKKNGSYLLVKRRISYKELKDVKKFPLFRLGRIKSGLISKKMNERIKPYGSLASRTVGDIFADETLGGSSGLESGFDKYLKGEPGVSSRQKVANRLQDVVIKEPVDGMDIISTIDINIQEIAEKALVDKLTSIEAQSGYAVVMEVKTGEIKAIVNMMRRVNGSYYEGRNGVLADKVEPGSTFKVASLMAVLDDGKAKLSDVIETGNGVYMFGRAAMRDHNAHRGGYHSITLENALNASSNIGISRTIYNAYGKNPGKFVDKLYQMGLNEAFDMNIPGIAKPNIRHPNDKSLPWYDTALPWMSIGYEVQLAPIYTLAFFNAIANNGKFIEPLVVKSINQNGTVVQSFKARVIREQICQPSTLQDVRQALLGVVENPKYGTGKAAHSSYVRIAGKTGTAQISQGAAGYKAGKKTHQVSFCGFFPFEDPKYTCIVVIREPGIGLPSGGLMAGSVVKNIAEKITAIDGIVTINDLKKDTTFIKTSVEPTVKSGNAFAIGQVMQNLNRQTINNNQEWVSTLSDNDSENVKGIEINRGIVPDLAGMGAKDALFLCEDVGLKVKLSGKGKVIYQNISAGTKISKGQPIELTLQ